MRHALVIAFLALATTAVYWPVTGFGFINFDDDMYVYDNDVVLDGLSLESVYGAVTDREISMWTPITLISYQAEVEFFGPDPQVMHTTNLVLHVLNAALMYALFAWMTGAWLPSAFVAALFALHPTHVESVAWISERKDVLSMLFWLGASLAYLRYARSAQRAWLYATALLFLVGLLAKPIVVTLPFVLILFDIWPLDRLRAKDDIWPRIREKLPLFLMMLVFVAITFATQAQDRAVRSLDEVPIAWRVGNAIVAYGQYMWRLFVPTELSVYYPHPGNSLGAIPVLAVGVALVAASVLAARLYRAAPYVTTGWFFFLGTLVPVIGLIPVGGQASADRYTYIAYTGLFWAGAWAVHATMRDRRKFLQGSVCGLSMCAVLAAGYIAHGQTRYWSGSEALFERALELHPDNPMAMLKLGDYYKNSGETRRAAEMYSKVLQNAPESHLAHTNLGLIYMDQEKFERALPHFQEAVKSVYKPVGARQRLGAVHQAMGNLERAEQWYREAIAVENLESESLLNAYLGLIGVLRQQGRYNEAEQILNEAREHYGDEPLLVYEAGILSEQRGEPDRAVAMYRLVVSQMPAFHEGWTRLGALLANLGEPAAALPCFEEAVQLEPEHTEYQLNLAMCHEMLGNIERAAEIRAGIKKDGRVVE